MTYTPDQTISVIDEEMHLHDAMHADADHPDLDERPDPDDRPAHAWDLRELSEDEVEWVRSYWH